MQISLAPGTRTSTFKPLVCSESPSLNALTALRSDECSYLRCITRQRGEQEQRAESGVLELSSHERNCIKTPTNVYATLYNICNRRAVTIQTNKLCPSFLAGIQQIRFPTNIDEAPVERPILRG